jgi:hypothetical protein
VHALAHVTGGGSPATWSGYCLRLHRARPRVGVESATAVPVADRGREVPVDDARETLNWASA